MKIFKKNNLKARILEKVLLKISNQILKQILNQFWFEVWDGMQTALWARIKIQFSDEIRFRSNSSEVWGPI